MLSLRVFRRIESMRFRYVAGCLLALCAAQVSADAEKAIRASLDKLNLSGEIKAVSPAPVDGLYQVQLESGRLLYASENGDHIIQGAIFDVSGAQPRNLTAEAEAKGIGEAIDAIPRSEMVIFPATERKAHITVFTDTDCGYCRKLHTEIDELNELGIEVRYAAFPRGGMSTETARTMQSIWCAKDQQAAMTRAKQGDSVKAATCDDPVAKQFELGRQVGVQGTPAIFLGNGVLIPGYKPAAALAKEALANQ